MATKKADAKSATSKASVKEKAKKNHRKKAAAPAEQAAAGKPEHKKTATRKKAEETHQKTEGSPTVKAIQEMGKPANDRRKKAAEMQPAFEGQEITVTTENGDFPASVIAVHGGNRVDAVLKPEAGQPFSLGSVPHQNDIDKKPYWQ